MNHWEYEIRAEIACHLLRETLLPLGRIARWTGLSRVQIQRMARSIRRPTIDL